MRFPTRCLHWSLTSGLQPILQLSLIIPSFAPSIRSLKVARNFTNTCIYLETFYDRHVYITEFIG